MDTDFECAVIGGGAAGLSSALVLGRARRRILVVDAGEQSNLPDGGVGGLLGNNLTPPAELYAKAAAEVDGHSSVERIAGNVVTGSKADEGFLMTTADGREFTSGSVILATGMKYNHPDLPGVAELWGRDAFHCPFCHGWEARDGRIAVIVGSAPDAMRARMIQLWTDKVTVLTDGSQLDEEQLAGLEAAGVPVIEQSPERLIVEEGSLKAVAFEDGSEQEFDSVMLPITMEHRSDLAAQFGARTREQENPFIIDPLEVDFLQKTSVPGLSAAGDISTQGAPSVAAAIAEGHRAAAGIVHDIALA